ncbi:hypothetical protein F3J16_21695 [Burkholderia sp. Ap-962]|uniref:hypothetical protein n=1 Tax=Burkholderia sp. Ap-962 TaxID=2608333 RepID=UPI00141DA4FB|nr:hypothetical protein [Burkholderia sp. Ap-962]NIF72776.1 hypothetical protein [Burkholderia sp. Ap-962]
MSDKLSDCAECGMPCAPGEYHPHAACLMFKACHDSTTVRDGLAAIREHALAASPAPAIPAGPDDEAVSAVRACLEQHAVYFSRSSIEEIVNAARKAAPAISESDDALLTAARRAILALARAAERDPAFQRDYEYLSKAIEDAARKGGGC